MRAVLAVIAAFLAMMVFTFGLSVLPWFALGVDRVFDPGTFDTTALVNAWSLAIAAIGAVIGGIVCGRIGRSKTAVIVLAAISLSLGLLNTASQSLKPEPGPRATGVSVAEAIQARREPTWYTLLIPVIGVSAILISGIRSSRTAAQR